MLDIQQPETVALLGQEDAFINGEKLTIAQAIAQQRYPDARVAFLAGSYVRGEQTPYSDLDMVVIYDKLPNAYRESFVFQDTPVEAFVHDSQTLEYFFGQFDRPSGVPSLMQMVKEGIPLTEDQAASKQYKQLAQKYLAMGPPALIPEDLERRRYFISDQLDDLREPRSYHEAVASGVKLYDGLADFYLRSRGHWSASGKSIPRVLKKTAPQFAERFTSAFDRLFRDADMQPVIALSEQVLEQQGGLLFAGFTLSAPADWRTIPAPNQPMFKHIESTIFFVEDIHAAANWYSDVLGSSVEYENPQYAFVRGAGMIFGFHPADEKNLTGPAGSVTYWEVEDVDATVQALCERGATLYRGPGQNDLGARFAMLKDPFGNALGLNARP